jgi:hypothetical protein
MWALSASFFSASTSPATERPGSSWGVWILGWVEGIMVVFYAPVGGNSTRCHLGMRRRDLLLDVGELLTDAGKLCRGFGLQLVNSPSEIGDRRTCGAFGPCPWRYAPGFDTGFKSTDFSIHLGHRTEDLIVLLGLLRVRGPTEQEGEPGMPGGVIGACRPGRAA